MNLAADHQRPAASTAAAAGTEKALPIAIRQLSKAYGALPVLDGIDLDVRPGEFLTLLGPSGSGKTTLLMAIAGFLRPDRGSIRFGDSEVVRLAPHKREIGMVFQNYALFPHMDVASNVGFPLRLRRVPAGEIARRVEAALEMFQLGGFGRRRIDQLSGGQRQRVALARAIVFEPRIILMDEPLSALDKQLRERMQIELRQLHERLGTTTVYVTHDQREALTMSDRIAVLDRGRIARIDTPRAIYDEPGSRFVAEFIGESSFLDVEVADGICRAAGATVISPRLPPPHGRRCTLVLRPERLRLLATGEGAGMNCFEGRVTGVIYQGDTLLLQAVLDDGSPVTVRQTTRSGDAGAIRPGEPVRIGIAIADTVLLADEPGQVQ
ncbi:MAG: ABC transporter ATP-binding protein [Bosea sp.]|uniref:ABC transporter ATP-binding protein n=1 Tax=unclassified Bosea (in: a-proteobacteria) TaxID=2653178 RepID=UPI000B244704|nr:MULTISPECIES: ABC transporter ATP-binding protein [unclassified Bosea (in: a-proteobacteria)]MBN9458275.1 ABC transporter ATP-binding protein [Bosea sp. (in: a-proteobacteria)]